MKNIKQIAILFFISIMLLSCKNEDQKKEEYFEEEIKPKIVEKYKCFGVDDCLSKYEFQGARDFAAEINKFTYGSYQDDINTKIVIAESRYWLNEKEYDRAYKIIKEFRIEFDILGDEKKKIEYEMLDDIISSLISEGEFDKALSWAVKSSDSYTPEGREVYNGEKYSKTDSQQKVLLNKIYKAKKILSKK